MQRLARIPIDEKNQKSIELLQNFKAIKAILARHLPPSSLTLFAEPRITNNVVEWYSVLQGQPRKIIDNKEKASFTGIINQRLDSIESLGKSLGSQGRINDEQWKQIIQLVNSAKMTGAEIYEINGDPVIVAWGSGEEPPKAVTPPPPVANKRHGLCCWLLPLLLLLLLILGLLWWFLWRQPEDMVTVVPPKAPIIKPLTIELPKPKEIKIEEPPKVEEPEPVTEIKPEEVKPEVEPKQTPTTVKDKVHEAKCTTKELPVSERDKMVIVFDNSSSMLATLLESPESIKRFIARYDTLFDVPTREEVNYMKREPTRLSAAKKAGRSIIDKISNNIDIGLVSLSSCPSATNHGFYSLSKRGVLKKRITGMKPFEDDRGGTPLYDGLAKAASMLDGKKKDAFILLLSDGEDACGHQNDICGLARTIAKRQPKLKINVVDIGGAKAANCVATATGGKVFTANNPSQVANTINQAIKVVEKPKDCK